MTPPLSKILNEPRLGFYASLTPRDIEIWHRTEDRSWLK
jgi:hypothetical protein